MAVRIEGRRKYSADTGFHSPTRRAWRPVAFAVLSLVNRQGRTYEKSRARFEDLVYDVTKSCVLPIAKCLEVLIPSFWYYFFVSFNFLCAHNLLEKHRNFG